MNEKEFRRLCKKMGLLSVMKVAEYLESWNPDGYVDEFKKAAKDLKLRINA